MKPDEQVALANHLARGLKRQMPATHGFFLLIAPQSTAPRKVMVTYISSVQQADMHRELKLLVAKWDADAVERGERP